ncbi:MAG: hypothetical protein MUE85_22950 [Microscillaceae bacterium]|nr:hypothetical protein [Microscillaceae bacterium]
MKTKIGIVTYHKYPDLHPEDRALAGFLDTSLFEICPIVWTNPHNLAEIDALIFRSCWDYHTQLPNFQLFLDAIATLQIPTWNPLPVIRRNLHKFYLQELANQNIPILPTVFLAKGKAVDIEAMMANQTWQRAVIKPAVSASSNNTFLIDKGATPNTLQNITNLLQENDLLLQKFIPEIATVGEVSIIFFANGFQYNILKKPKTGDFRVQQEFGGSADWVELPQFIVNQARRVLDIFAPDYLFARVDGIICNEVFYLMELEMIEPYLFTNCHPQASENLAKSIVLKLNS